MMFRKALGLRGCHSLAASGLSNAEKLAVQVATNDYPGHRHLYNVNVGDESVDPVTGEPYAPAQHASPALQQLLGDTPLQQDVLNLKRNPPVQFDLPPTRFHLGNPAQFAGGAIDPSYKQGHLKTAGVSGPYLTVSNESEAGLLQYAFDSATVKNGVLHQPLDDTTGRATQVRQMPFTGSAEAKGFTELPLVRDASAAAPEHPGRMEQEVQWHLSSCGVAFAQDGALGSTTDDEVRIQIHTDSSAHALYWKLMLHGLPARSRWEMMRFTPPVRLFHCPGFKEERERVVEEYGGPKLRDLGLQHGKFALVDPYAKPCAAIVAGDASLDLAQDLVAYMTAVVMHEELSTLVLPGDALIDEAGNATVYVTGTSPAAKAHADALRRDASLYAAHHVTLSPDGLGHLWDGVTHSQPEAEDEDLPPNSLVTTENGVRRVTKPLLRVIGDETSVRKVRSSHPGAPARAKTNYASVDASRGMKLGKSTPAKAPFYRPRLVDMQNVKVVFLQEGGKAADVKGAEAGKLFADAVKAWGYQYASDEDLASAFVTAIEAGLSVSVAPLPTGKSTPSRARKGKKSA